MKNRVPDGIRGAVGITTLLAFMQGCMPQMPSTPKIWRLKPTADGGIFDPSTAGTSAPDVVYERNLKFAVASCSSRMNALVGRARGQRDWGNVVAITSASLSALSGGFGAYLAASSGNPNDGASTGPDNRSAVAATSIASGTLALLAVAAKFIGDPRASLDSYKAALAHYTRARELAEALNICDWSGTSAAVAAAAAAAAAIEEKKTGPTVSCETAVAIGIPETRRLVLAELHDCTQAGQ